MDLIEIFKAGTHTDSSGKTREWTDEDLEEIASLYNPSVHEAPIVIGHPETDSPAYGWVESLKTEGGKLLAKLKDIAPEFVDWVKRGLYKKVSIALYPDLGLRHIGFLGATPPAIKGLKQATFSEKAAWIIVEDIKMADQSQEKQAQEARAKKWGIAIKDGGNVTKSGEWSSVSDDDFLDPVNYRYPCPDADQTRVAAAYWGKPKNQEQYSSEERAIINKRLEAKEKQFNIGKFQKGGTHMDISKFFSDLKTLVIGAEKDLTPDTGAKFTEGEVQARENKVKAEAEKIAFAEIEKLKKEKTEVETKMKKIEEDKRKSEIHAFCEGLAKEGKIIPAWQKMGIEEFIFNLDGLQSIKFAEGQEKSRSQWFMDFIKELPKVVTFKEVVTGDGPASGGKADEKLSALIKTKMEQKKDLSYSSAFTEVQKENPELAKEYQQEIHPNK